MRETEGACAAEETRRPSTKGARAAEGARKPKEARRLELRHPRTVLEEQISELEARIKQREEQIETLEWWPGSRCERQSGGAAQAPPASRMALEPPQARGFPLQC